MNDKIDPQDTPERQVDSSEQEESTRGDQSADGKGRRRFLSGITAGTVAGVGVSSGGKWVKPVVESVILPGHAQTTGVTSTFRVKMIVDEPDTDVEAYRQMVFHDGTHTVDEFDDTNDIDDPHFSFRAVFDPPLSEPVQVKMHLVTDTDFDFGNLTTDEKVSTKERAIFSTLDADDGADDPALVTATFSAPGFPTRRVRVRFNPS